MSRHIIRPQFAVRIQATNFRSSLRPREGPRYALLPPGPARPRARDPDTRCSTRSEEHTSELQSRQYLVCRLLLEKKKKITHHIHTIYLLLYQQITLLHSLYKYQV